MKFTPIELITYPRRQIFYYFSKMAPTGYSLTVNMDVTTLRKTLSETGRKFFPTYLYLVTKCLSEQIEFKTAYKDDILGYYDYLTPLYAHFHDDDKTFSLMWTEYNEDYDIFYSSYMENKMKYGDNHGILSQPATPPPANAYTVSCIPWIEFNSFSVHSYDNKPYFFPSVEAGKFYDKAGHSIMPLSITCHHASTDGYHVDRFIKKLQYEMDHFTCSHL